MNKSVEDYANSLLEDKSVSNKTFIECECGVHVLAVQNEVEYLDPEEIPDPVNSKIKYKRTRFFQEFSLAMFHFGHGSDTISFWKRFGVAWHIIKTGKPHLDQILMNPEEAKKLADFINANLVRTEEYASQ